MLKSKVFLIEFVLWCIVPETTETLLNVALRKTATQSKPSKYPPYRAVDGNKNRHLIRGQSCSETRTVNDAFWEVDLNDNFVVESIVVHNRGDCCAERLHDVLFSVSNDHISYTTFGFHAGQVPQIVTLTPDSPMMARWVRLSMQGSGSLALCEVEVMSKKMIKTNYFQPLQSAQGSESILQSFHVKSPMQCLYECSKTSACFSIKVVDTSAPTAYKDCTLLSSITYNASISTNVHFYTSATVSLSNY